MNMLLNIFNEIRIVAGQMSPYLLFGFLAAGVLHVTVSPDWMRRHLGGRGLMPVLKSVLMGVPLPLCSCGVIAVTASIRKQGAGRGAATGFLLATPQTGVDSILATWGMMGPAPAIFRPIVALITGIVGGVVAALFDRNDSSEQKYGPHCGDSSTAEEARPERSVREVLHYGLVVLPADIAKPLVVGVILAGLIAALAPRDTLAPYIGGGIVAMILMTIIGIPLYVCATASIPVALSFMHLGASPGAALAFLIAGPATNAATIATVWKLLGRTTAVIYLATVFLGAILSGLLFDGLTSLNYGISIHLTEHTHAHETQSTLLIAFWALLLILVMANSVYGSSLRNRWNHLRKPKHADANAHNQVVLHISGMTCRHCTEGVASALRNLGGVQTVQINLEDGKTMVSGDHLDSKALIEVIEKLGYSAALVS